MKTWPRIQLNLVFHLDLFKADLLGSTQAQVALISLYFVV